MLALLFHVADKHFRTYRRLASSTGCTQAQMLKTDIVLAMCIMCSLNCLFTKLECSDSVQQPIDARYKSCNYYQ